jgi:hypothetical protein
MTHFKDSVPKEIQDKLESLANLVELDYISDQVGDACGCVHNNEISGNSYDGFMAFTDGGYEVTEYYGNSRSSGCYFSKDHEKSDEKYYDEMYKYFCEEMNIEQDAELTEEQQDLLSEIEQENQNEALLRFECWANQDDFRETKTETIFLRVSVNYSDAPYFRSNHDETLKEMAISFAEFLETENEKLAIDLFN